MNVPLIAEQITGTQIVSLDRDEETEVYALKLSNGLCLYLVGGIGLQRVNKESLH